MSDELNRHPDLAGHHLDRPFIPRRSRRSGHYVEAGLFRHEPAVAAELSRGAGSDGVEPAGIRVGLDGIPHRSVGDDCSTPVRNGRRETDHVPGPDAAGYRAPPEGGVKFERMRGIGHHFDARLRRQFAESRGQGGRPGSERPEDTRGLPQVGGRTGPVVERMGVVGPFEERAVSGDRADPMRFDGDVGTDVTGLGSLVLGEQPDRDTGSGQDPLGQPHEAQGGEFRGQDLDRDLDPDARIVRAGESGGGPGRWGEGHQGVIARPMRSHHPGVGDADVRRIEREEQHPRPPVHLSAGVGDGRRDAARLAHPKAQRLGSHRQLPLLARRRGGEAQETRTGRTGRKTPPRNPLEHHGSRVSQDPAPRPTAPGGTGWGAVPAREFLPEMKVSGRWRVVPC